jgi:hypothetical protein
MRTVADSDSATSESDVGNSHNTDNEVETDSASECESDNVDDTSSEVGDEYESDPWAPSKAEEAQQSLSEFEVLTQNFTAELQGHTFNTFYGGFGRIRDRILIRERSATDLFITKNDTVYLTTMKKL